MIYYPNAGKQSSGVKISYAKFKEIFGVSYPECEQAEYLDKNMKTHRYKFVAAHCCKCPYASDINGEVVPIIEYSYHAVEQMAIDAAYEC